MPRRLIREPHLLAHELRTPLSVLGGWMSLIRDGDITPQSDPARWTAAMQACELAVTRLNLVIAEACDEGPALKYSSESAAQISELMEAAKQAIDHSHEVFERIRSRRQAAAPKAPAAAGASGPGRIGD